ncbi:MAG: glycoside hydrolase family 3 C-terminal domain-containing protein, partial [Bacteroidetes bacterium]|nr:glycoside hydrolase family 3 C-terminal domain-containing protein [Bacteroidota bacterium]
YLTSEIACNYIQGLQSKKVIAVAKHLIANDQEFCRHMMSSDVDERALREIYLPPWEAVIEKGGIKGVMTGNNLLNGIPNSMNKPLLADVLRKEYGFSGIAMTDWQNTIYHPAKQNLVLNSGISLLMPTNETFANYLSTYLENNPSKKAEVERELDQMVYDNLLPLFEMGVYDRQAVDSSYLPSIKEHKIFARKCAEEAICLLKNENHLLPVSLGKKVLMMGGPEVYSGQGSGFVLGFDHTDFASGMQNVYGQNFKCIVKPSDEEIRNADVVLYRLNKPAGEGEDVPFYEPAEVNPEIIHCASLNPNVVVIISAGNGLDMPWLPKIRGVLYTYFLGQERGNALADIISGKVNPSGHLPFTLEKKFEDSPAPEFNYLGGKPYWHGDNSYYKDYWMGKPNAKVPEFAPFVKPGEVIHKTYKEGIFIGYRWYEKNKIAVSFPFGFGLSYTTFKYNSINLSSSSISGSDILKVKCSISNSGPVAGAEVVQLYIHDDNASVERPVKELKGFKKIFLQPGETKQVDFVINREDLSFWDTQSHNWKAGKGKFNVLIGSSSNNITLSGKFNLLK